MTLASITLCFLVSGGTLTCEVDVPGETGPSTFHVGTRPTEGPARHTVTYYPTCRSLLEPPTDEGGERCEQLYTGLDGGPVCRFPRGVRWEDSPDTVLIDGHIYRPGPKKRHTRRRCPEWNR
jgi:hypothetical protein